MCNKESSKDLSDKMLNYLISMILYGNIGLFHVKKFLQPAFNKLTAVAAVGDTSVFEAPIKSFYGTSIALINFQMV